MMTMTEKMSFPIGAGQREGRVNDPAWPCCRQEATGSSSAVRAGSAVPTAAFLAALRGFPARSQNLFKVLLLVQTLTAISHFKSNYFS